jgi:folate-binding protein YgfZ
MIEAGFVVLEDRSVIGVGGPDARTFLQGLISNDVNKVTPARAIYAALLTPQGKFLHDFFIAELDGRLLLDCETGRAADLLKRLTLYRLRSKVELTDLTLQLRVAAIIGDGAAAALGLGSDAGTAKAIGNGVGFVDPRLSAMGVRAVLPAASAVDTLIGFGLPAVTIEDYHRHRLALGVPDGSRDVAVDKSFLLESNFEELNAIDFNKGCYVGQELTARTKYRGVVRKRLFRVEVDGPLPLPGTPVMLGEKEAGTMRSGLEHVGIALLRLEDVEAASKSGQRLTAGEARLTPIKPDWVNL